MIAIGCDHGGFKLKEEIKKYLDEIGAEYSDEGCYSEESVHYPIYAKKVCLKILNGECDKGILICTTGNGMAIAANKFKGIRCTKCNTEQEATLSRNHNDSNVLSLPAGSISTELAIKIVRLWLASGFDMGRHEIRVNMIKEIENENMK